MNVLVVGGGKVGLYLASLLLGEGHKVKLIEVREDEIDHLRKELPLEVVVWGSGSDPNVLEAAGIRQTQVVAAVTGDDETNLVVTSLARFEFKVGRTIGRVNNPKNAWLFTNVMGVDVALNQADLMARLIREEMSLGDMMTLLKLRKGVVLGRRGKSTPQLGSRRQDGQGSGVARAVRADGGDQKGRPDRSQG